MTRSAMLGVRAAAGAMAVGMALAGCATVATRPGERLPLVVIEVNNTSTQSDDRVAGGAMATTTPARIRIANTGSGGVTAPIPVEITNMDPTAGSQLQVGASCASLAGSAFVTLPATGAWIPLCLRGLAPNPQDFGAVIEVRENREDGTILARHGVQIAAIEALAGKGVFLNVGAVSTLDDYVGWSPRIATVQIADPAAFAAGNPGATILPIRLSNASPSLPAALRGQLLFAAAPGGPPPSPSAMSAMVDLDLPADGSQVNFYMAGQFGAPSKRDKDAVILVTQRPSGLLAMAPMMVRVRQDANTLSPHERDRFLRALIKLNGTKTGGTFTALGQNWFNYQDIHNQIGPSGHSNFAQSGITRPAFLPWHRLFILRLERELQALDPSVSLNYWNFTETDAAKAPVNIFNTAFVGETVSGQWVTLGMTNPLAPWSTRWPNFGSSATVSGIRRSPLFAPTALPTNVNVNGCVGPVGEPTVLAFGPNFNSPALNSVTGFMRMEWRAHNRAHVTGGGINTCTGTVTQLGWLTSVAQPIQDPLFFMLHSNVDRLWAKWQQQNNRFDPNVVANYPNQGTGSGGDVGQFTLDPLWPWSDPAAPGGVFPTTLGQAWAPQEQATILNAVDYERSWVKLGTNPPQQLGYGLGYAYDDVPFGH